MTTLGQRYKESEQKRNPEDDILKLALENLFRTRNQPKKVNALSVLRQSLKRVVAKAKADFEAGIEANYNGPEFLTVATYIPISEACYEFLNNGARNDRGLRFQGATPDTQKLLNDIWNPFLDWAKAEGLHLHRSGLGEAYGVRHFLVLEASVDDGNH